MVCTNMIRTEDLLDLHEAKAEQLKIIIDRVDLIHLGIFCKRWKNTLEVT